MNTDELTRLANRRRFSEFLERAKELGRNAVTAGAGTGSYFAAGV